MLQKKKMKGENGDCPEYSIIQLKGIYLCKLYKLLSGQVGFRIQLLGSFWKSFFFRVKTSSFRESLSCLMMKISARRSLIFNW